MKLTKTFAASILMTMAAICSADTIELKNGKTLQGKIISQAEGVVSFEIDGIALTLNSTDIKSMTMGVAPTPAAAAPAIQTAKVTGPVEIPAGTVMMVNMGMTLDTGKHATGHKFTAVLEGALVQNGVTVAPAGSKIYGVVSESVKARRVAGKAKMILTITDININGQMVAVRTNAINAHTQATGKSSAAKVARGAAIGGLAGGSSGAKTGAKVGVAGAVLSGGNQVVIPAGTLLDFTLTQALVSAG
ncbi:MAG: hypothetical protein HRU20_01505 [Pseudomonadales bacterium]|nr:hypothetical protein [Pseudomonadales bacterium]